jgi:hypothetical protein
VALTILTLTVAMIEAPFWTLLVAAVGLAALVKACSLAADEAAIALAAVTVRTQKENGAAFAAQANPQPENNLAIARHARRRAQLDNSNRSVSP